MPSDDRERNFDNALASHLRTTGERLSACVDTETLAAYHEGSLDPLQIAFVKTHVSDCARCQEILASLQATDDIPVAAANIAPSETPAEKPGVHLLPARKPTVWRWVAPAGALAAALLVWVAVRENNSVQLSPPAPKIVAQPNQAADSEPSPALATKPPDSAPAKKSEASEPLEGNIPATQSETTNLPAQHPPSMGSLAKQKDSSRVREKLPSLDESNQFADASANRLSLPSSSGTETKTLSPGAVSQMVTVEPAKPGVSKNEPAAKANQEKAANDKRDARSPTPAPAPPTLSTGAAAAPVARSQSQTVEVNSEAAQIVEVSPEAAGVSGGIVQQQEMAGMSRFDEKTRMRLARSVAAVTVSAPEGNVSWRIGQAGVIEFSSDAGKTWAVQPSGIITDLLAGSAPSAKVCWLVGSAGTILRTTDGGKHWFKINPPAQDDLRSVFAVDASRATVSPASGSYQTTDGGSTWNKLPPP